MNSKTELLAARLRSERSRLGLSQGQFAAAGGVSKATEAAYESGQRVPDLAYLDGIAVLGVDPVFMVTGLPSRAYVAENFNWDLLIEIVIAVWEFQTERKMSIPSEKFGDLICLLYDEFFESGNVEPALLARALRLVA